MAVTIPNLDKIQKDDPKAGEAFKRIKDYLNLNLPQAPGNRVPSPPVDSTSIKA